MTLTIDGRTIAFEGRPTLLEVARANGVFIPSLCDHPALEPYAACRLCLVEVKGRRGYVPACQTAAEDGLEVLTATPELTDLRRGILELILVEHPHACLICAEKSSCDDLKSTIRKTGEVTGCVLCPENGHCELQKVVQAVGLERVPLPAGRRAGEVRRDDPFIDRDNSLCILCGRCVRVCQEVRGATVLTFVRRGSQTFVGAALDRRLLDSGCRFCGACVDVCPTGSLADRSVRYESLPDAEKPSICPFCAQGCRMRVGTRDGRIVGAIPDPDGPANGGQACVKGRFLAKAAVGHARRLQRPMVRKDGRLKEVAWDEALAAASRLAELPGGTAAVALSAQSSCEDLFVLHRFAAEALEARACLAPWPGSAASALRRLGRAANHDVALNVRLEDIGRAGAIVLLGEDLPLTQAIVGVEVNRAVRRGAFFLSVGLKGRRPSGRAPLTIDLPAGAEAPFLKALAVLVLGRQSRPIKGAGSVAFRKSLAGFDVAGTCAVTGVSEATLAGIARALAGSGPVYVLFGPALLSTAGGRNALAPLWNLAALTGARVVPLDWEANVRGGLEIAAAFPIRTSWPEPLTASHRGLRALYIAGPCPKFEREALELVICQGSYDDENTAVADVVLPETVAFETDGTFVNVEGRAQLSRGVVEPLGEARPGWTIVGELAAKMGRAGFAYASAAEIRKDMARAVPAFAGLADGDVPETGRFLAEPAAAPVFFVGPGAGERPGREPTPETPRDADDYKGLNLAREHKSLRLIRGR